MLMVCLFSLGVFADSTTCKVYGSKTNNVVTVTTPIVNTDNSTLEVHLQSSQRERMSVVLHIYKGEELVKTQMVEFHGSETIESGKTVFIHNMEKNQTYFVKIASASCN